MKLEKNFYRTKLVFLVLALATIVLTFFTFPGNPGKAKDIGPGSKVRDVQTEKILKDSLDILIREFCNNGNYKLSISQNGNYHNVIIDNIIASELILNVNKNKFLRQKNPNYEVSESNRSITLKLKIEKTKGLTYVFVPLDVLYKLLSQRSQKS